MRPVWIMILAFAGSVLADAPPDAFYTLRDIPGPQNIPLEVGGLSFSPDGTLFLCTRRGDVLTYREGKWKRFASGLQEALGILAEKNDQCYITQRAELTHLVDSDNDGTADRFEAVCDDFGYSGNYHEYNFGLVRDKVGNFYGTLNLSFAPDAWGGVYMGVAAKYRGWCYQVTPKGQFVPFAPGLRSPNGITMSPDGDIFVTDNQGEFTVTNVMHHIQKGKFYGHPSSLSHDSTRKVDPKTTTIEDLDRMRELPAIFFPYDRMGRSVSQPLFDTTAGKFGPFAGQMFIGDVNVRIFMRVFLEKVAGEFQGACFPFMVDDSLEGANRLAFAPDGSLFIGVTNRGWGRGTMGLRQMKWTGKPPFEMLKIELTKTGFDLTFTNPVDIASAQKPESYSLLHYEYKYSKNYGCPELNLTPVKLTRVDISADGRRASLTLPEVLARKVYQIQLKGLKSADGLGLRNDIGWYTLNRLRD